MCLQLEECRGITTGTRACVFHTVKTQHNLMSVYLCRWKIDLEDNPE